MKAITTAVAQQAIQLIGQQLGLPPSVINMAQQAFSAASGQPGGGMSSIGEAISSLTEQFNLSPSEAGSLMRTADEAQRSLVKGILESEEFAQAKNGGSAKGSIFMQIATALGKLADKKMGEMA